MSLQQSRGLSPVDMRDVYLVRHAEEMMRIEVLFVGMVEDLRRMRCDLVSRVKLRSGDTEAMMELRDAMEASPHRSTGVLPDGSRSVLDILQDVFKSLPARPGLARRGRPKVQPGTPQTGYSLEYFAYRAGVSLTTVKRLVRRGVIHRNLAGRIPHEFLEAYVEGRPLPVRSRRSN